MTTNDPEAEAAMNDPGGFYSFAGMAGQPAPVGLVHNSEFISAIVDMITAPYRAKPRDRIAEQAQKIAVAQSVTRCGSVLEPQPQGEE